MSNEAVAPAANGAAGGLIGAGTPVELAEAITASAVIEAPPSTPVAQRPPVAQSPAGAAPCGAVGAALVASTLLAMAQLLALWPAVVAASQPKPDELSTPLLFGIAHTTFDPDVTLITMVMLVGALGSLVGGSRRFLAGAGDDDLTRRDEWSYLVRTSQGAALALIVYFTLRGGYLGQDQSAGVNPYGVAALSALVGLFSRHAVSKLTDVFDTLFGKPKEDVSPVSARES
jgi:hypothetical protein